MLLVGIYDRIVVARQRPERNSDQEKFGLTKDKTTSEAVSWKSLYNKAIVIEYENSFCR